MRVHDSWVDTSCTFRNVQLSPQADVAAVEEEVGIELGPYFPHNAWLLCSNRQVTVRISRIRGVEWVVSRPYSHKLAPALDVVMQVVNPVSISKSCPRCTAIKSAFTSRITPSKYPTLFFWLQANHRRRRPSRCPQVQRIDETRTPYRTRRALTRRRDLVVILVPEFHRRRIPCDADVGGGGSSSNSSDARGGVGGKKRGGGRLRESGGARGAVGHGALGGRPAR